MTSSGAPDGPVDDWRLDGWSKTVAARAARPSSLSQSSRWLLKLAAAAARIPARISASLKAAIEASSSPSLPELVQPAQLPRANAILTTVKNLTKVHRVDRNVRHPWRISVNTPFPGGLGVLASRSLAKTAAAARKLMASTATAIPPPPAATSTPETAGPRTAPDVAPVICANYGSAPPPNMPPGYVTRSRLTGSAVSAHGSPSWEPRRAGTSRCSEK